MISIFNKLKPIIEIAIVYLLWIVVHFIIGNLYSTYCVEYSFYGLITSPFVSITPHCKAFRLATVGAIKLHLCRCSLNYLFLV